jgi:succinyl-CoA synthetase alpha subunit
MPAIETAFRNYIVHNPDDAEVIFINSEGITALDTGDIIQNYKDTKKILCLGPSTAGIARLNHVELWCPFGTSKKTSR